ETFRKMLISMAKDLRVIMIKFADRLHNMRTLGHPKKEDRRRAIAAETPEVYAPRAHRFGLRQSKWERDDPSFRHLNPDTDKNPRSTYARSSVPPRKRWPKRACRRRFSDAPNTFTASGGRCKAASASSRTSMPCTRCASS